MDKKDFIGIFDSGIGGISVLKHAVTELENEDFIFYGDCGHFPYGEKTPEEVRKYTMDSCRELYREGAKAILIACNTATSAAVIDMREEFRIPVISMEPAIKPAHLENETGKILVMATPGTIHSDRFQRLVDRVGCEDRLIRIACEGLASLVEKGDFESEEIREYVRNKFSPYSGQEICGIVIGCTHYSFITPLILEVAREFFTGRMKAYDGMYGTVAHLKDILSRDGKLRSDDHEGSVRFLTSGTDEDLTLMKEIYYK